MDLRDKMFRETPDLTLQTFTVELLRGQQLYS